jgi:hypothetical protein
VPIKSSTVVSSGSTGDDLQRTVKAAASGARRDPAAAVDENMRRLGIDQLVTRGSEGGTA